jgi:hypothetical protein
MKLRLKSALFSSSVLLGAITCLTGCASIGMDRTTKTTNSEQTVESDYKQAPEQIDATRASLENLIKPDQTDITYAYDTYVENVKRMETLGKQLNMLTEKMRARGNEYFAEGDFSSTIPEIRELSEWRRIEMKESDAKFPEASIEVINTLKSYLSEIIDIQKYLSNDLTPQGTFAIRSIAQRALMDGDSLKEMVKNVPSGIDQVKPKMAQGGINTECSTECDLK